MRAVTLARVSTKGQAEHGYSLDDQDRILLRHVQAKGYTLIEQVRDEGFSGQLSQRPGLTRVMELVKARVVDAVLFVKMDRVGREQRIILNTIHNIKQHGVRVEFVEHVSGDTKEERLQLGVMASVAEFQWETIKQLTSDGRYNKAREKGAYPGRLTVYGYHVISKAEAALVPEYHGRSGQLVIVEEQAEVVREIFRRFVAGESIHGITNDLNQRMVSSARGTTWAYAVVRKILVRPTYKGTLYYGQQECRKVDELTRGGNQRSRRTPRPREQWVEIPCPAIVDLETWEQAQRILGANQEVSHRGRPSTVWPLRGVVFCGVCEGRRGEPRQFSTTRATRNQENPRYHIRYYRCSSSSDATARIGDWCRSQISARRLEVMARQMLTELTQPGRMGDIAAEQTQAERETLGDLPVLQAQWKQQLDRLADEERNLIRLARQGVSTTMLAEEINKLQAQRAALEEKIAGGEQRLRALQSPAAARRRAEEVSARIRERLAQATAEEEPAILQEIYRALFRITIRPGEDPVFEYRIREALLSGS